MANLAPSINKPKWDLTSGLMPIMIIEVGNASGEPRPENAGSEIYVPNKTYRCFTGARQGQKAEYPLNFEVAIILEWYTR